MTRSSTYHLEDILGPNNPFSNMSNLLVYQVGMSLFAIAAGWGIWQATKPSSSLHVGNILNGSIKGKKAKYVLDGVNNVPCGIHNIGNTCFMNSVLQALASLDTFKVYLKELSTNNTKSFLALEVDRVIEELRNYDRSNSIDLYPLVGMLAGGKNYKRLLCYEQQDAHEFLQLLSSSLFQQHQVNPLLSLHKIKDISSYISPKWKGILKKDLNYPLTGIYAFKMTCRQCSYSSPLQHQVFNIVSCSISSSKYNDISSSLRQFIKSEIVEGWKCNYCTLKKTLQHHRIQLQKLQLKKAKKSDEQPSDDIENVLQKMPNPTQQTHLDHESIQSPIKNNKRKKKKVKKLNEVPSSLQTKISEFDALSEYCLLESNMENNIRLIEERLHYAVDLELPNDIKSIPVYSPEAIRQCRIANAPTVLVLHIQRSLFLPYGHAYKNSSPVYYPKYLDLGSYMTNPCVDFESRAFREKFGIPEYRKTKNDPLYFGNSSIAKWSNSISQPSLNNKNDSPVLKFFEKADLDVDKSLTKKMPDKYDLENSSLDLNPQVETVSSNEQNLKKHLNEKHHPQLSKQIDTELIPINLKYPFMYELSAVVMHYGSHESGHFVSYRKVKQSPNKSAWFYISDTKVELVNESEVYENGCDHVYMLFYEKL